MILRNSSKIPLQIDRYRILSQLGKGGFGTTYHVVDRDDMRREYALKFLHSAFNLQRIEKELDVLKILNTSSLFLKTYASKKTLNNFFLLFEYSPKPNLYKQVKEQLFDETKAIEILLQLLDALEFLHEHKIIHGDIKAENILQKDERYYLIDFDTVKLASINPTLHIDGDDDFTPPEVYKGRQTVASDIYALGCLLYFMVSGKHIYNFNKETGFAQKMFAHLYMNPLEDENISDKMYYLIQRMTDKDETTRATIEEIKKIINQESFEKLEKTERIEDNFLSEYDQYKYMAEDGVAYAQNIFGLLHEESYSDKNMQDALLWYEKASRQDLVKADFNLGLYYKMGKGGSVDYDKAKEYFFKASHKGHSRSLFHLADMYEKGLGVELNKQKSLQYYKSSAMYGYKPAYKKLQELFE